jgi:TonB family protein
LPRPAFPIPAAAARLGGEVIVGVKIKQDGHVSNATVVSGYPLLQAAALAAARQAVFEPSLDNSDRAAVLTYRFLFQSPDSKVGIKKYSNNYRVEVQFYFETVNTSASRN